MTVIHGTVIRFLKLSTDPFYVGSTQPYSLLRRRYNLKKAIWGKLKAMLEAAVFRIALQLENYE